MKEKQSSASEASTINWIQHWYAVHCDGDWEHQYGISIETLDNPGWAVVIELNGTDLSSRSMDPLHVDEAPDDWMQCTVSDLKFKGYGDPSKLSSILTAFRRWVETK